MLDVLAASFAGFLLLAATTHRLRHHSGAGPRARSVLRVGGAAMLVLAYALADAPLTGEGEVRFLGLAILAAAALILLLSIAPAPLLRPLRALLSR